jgi:flagellar hook-basal body complex protein FliE
MTSPIGGISAIGGIGSIGGISPVTSPAVSAPGGATAGADFASQLSKGLDTLQSSQDNADNLAVKAATGDLTDVHDYMIASTEASLGMQLTTAVRNKALDAFNEIMRMQA